MFRNYRRLTQKWYFYIFELSDIQEEIESDLQDSAEKQLLWKNAIIFVIFALLMLPILAVWVKSPTCGLLQTLLLIIYNPSNFLLYLQEGAFCPPSIEFSGLPVRVPH